MNNPRRKRIKEAYDLIDQGRSILEEVKDEEQEYADNMPESMHGHDKHTEAEEDASTLEEAHDSAQEAIEHLDNLNNWTWGDQE